jgi:fructose-1,6-bisphosphatase/inositol monophosphatase family enzyme
MASLDHRHVLDVLRAAADEAEAVIKENLRKNFTQLGLDTGMGADGSPTKLIDKIAEDAIFEVLKSEELRVNILSEESAPLNVGADHTLLVDPIDGTRNAVRGVPFFCVCLAYGHGTDTDGIEVALVRNIPTGDTFHAVKGQGAWFNGVHIEARPLSQEIMVAAVFEADPTAISWKSKPHFHLRDCGSSSLEMCLVATGAFDVFVNATDWLRVIDIAAPALIVREAGGEVYDIKGTRLVMPYDLKPRKSVVAVRHPGLLKEVIA